MGDTISVDSLAMQLGADGVTVIDVRPSAAYNGWRLEGEARGGHVPGALAFPLSWTVGTSDEEVAAELARKGVSTGETIVVYAYNDQAGTAFAARLQSLGFEDVAILDGGWPAWAEREDLDVRTLPRFRHLVHAGWLEALLAGDPVEEAPSGDFALFHVNSDAPGKYAAGHIPGAAFLDTNLLESERDWNRRSPGELEAALLGLGITSDTTVILYGRDGPAPGDDDGAAEAGLIAAARAAGILLYAGVEDVRILDGGIAAWLAAGHEMEKTVRTPVPVEDFGRRIPAHPEFFIDFEDAALVAADSEDVLVSVRSLPEHVGETSGYDYIRQAGDIPGAIWGNSGSDAHHMEHYRNADDTMRSFDEIATNWRSIGITPERNVSFYCGTGSRASEAFFYAYLMGWTNISIYDGGWLEWSRRADTAS